MIVLDLFCNGKVQSLGDTNNVVLLELPEMFIPEAIVSIIKLLRNKGVRCIIAHPERNSLLLAKRSVLDSLICAGAELQLTGGSLLGKFGNDHKKLADYVFQSGARCYLGSDGHCEKKRKPVLAKAVKIAARRLGKLAATKLVTIDLTELEKRVVQFA